MTEAPKKYKQAKRIVPGDMVVTKGGKHLCTVVSVVRGRSALDRSVLLVEITYETTLGGTAKATFRLKDSVEIAE